MYKNLNQWQGNLMNIMAASWGVEGVVRSKHVLLSVVSCPLKIKCCSKCVHGMHSEGKI